MIRAQEYINNLLQNVAEGQISSDEYRLTFGRIKDKLVVAEDYEMELRTLYKVSNFSDFALSLMWIAERVELDPAKLDFTPDEQALVVAKFRDAVGDAGPAPVAETSAAAPFFEPPPEDQVMEAAPPAEEVPEMPQHLQMEVAGPIDEVEKSVYAPPPSVTAGGEGEFGILIEKFTEAMQSGSEERESVMSSVLGQCNAIAATGSGYPDDLREFCQFMIDFLKYITENGFVDDVRVMNILSNVSGPVVSWSTAAADARPGLLAEASEILRTFKSLFE